MTDKCSRVINPILYIPLRENESGIFALMLLMSMSHYGLVICMHTSERFEELEIEEIATQIVFPFTQEMPHFVGRYRERLQEVVHRFVTLSPVDSYDFEILDYNAIGFLPIEGDPAPRHDSRTARYIFVAPADVPFEEFVVASSLFLN
jgi:hypothetical protein